ncbi:MAG TPA: DNA integrity scanning protein DisA nucleotide-binding domain protein [Candidatus Paceibacterota bacterium]|nr:DNA integrity scanning protein DisA nucleotide-binding domain protein [Candidatus Paceibacterota bacterium]
MAEKKKSESKEDKNLKKLEELLIQVGLRIAKRGEGALFVIGSVEYRPLIKQQVPPFNALNNPKLLESLALMDGAVILDKTGVVTAYGVMIKSKRAFKNFGTRHSAGYSASYNGNTSVIISEEDRKIRIMRNGKMVMQIDALQKNVEKSVPEVVEVLESLGAGTVGAVGTSLLVPALGIAFLPGVVMFGSAYYLAKLLRKKKVF